MPPLPVQPALRAERRAGRWRRPGPGAATRAARRRGPRTTRHRSGGPGPGRYATRSGSLRTSASSVAATWCRPSPGSPSMARSSGRTRSSVTTRALTGLPGQPDDDPTVDPPHRQRLAGLDGDAPEVELAKATDGVADVVMAADAHAARGEDDVAASAASRSAASTAVGLVADPGQDDGFASRSRRSPRPGPGRWRRRCGRRRVACRGPSSSSPLDTMATRGRARTSTSASPSEARTPMPAGVSGAGSATVSPARMSWPAARTSAPGETDPGISTAPSDSVARSIGTTASAPGGIGAPVEIRTAVPACDLGQVRAPGSHLPDQPQRAGNVGCAHREAVHGRVRERWDVNGCGDRSPCQGPTQGIGEGHGFHPRRGHHGHQAGRAPPRE